MSSARYKITCKIEPGYLMDIYSDLNHEEAISKYKEIMDFHDDCIYYDYRIVEMNSWEMRRLLFKKLKKVRCTNTC
jgi:hypothetical protein